MKELPHVTHDFLKPGSIFQKCVGRTAAASLNDPADFNVFIPELKCRATHTLPLI